MQTKEIVLVVLPAGAPASNFWHVGLRVHGELRPRAGGLGDESLRVLIDRMREEVPGLVVEDLR